MNRRKSPEIRTRKFRQLERERAAEQQERRENILILIGVILLTLSTTTAYFVFYAIPRFFKQR